MRPSDFVLTVTEVTNATGEPEPGFSILGRLSNPTSVPWVIFGTWCDVQIQDRSHCLLHLLKHVPVKLPGIISQNATNEFVEVRVDLSARKFEWVENLRSSTGGFRLFVQLEICGASFTQEPGKQVAQFGVPDVFQLIPLNLTNGFEVSRDTWLNLLRTMGFGTTEVFELPTTVLAAAPDLKKALEDLRAADQAFRSGDWDGTLAKSRLAFEAAARVVGISDDLKTGFLELWDRALPFDKDAAKRSPLNNLVRELANFQHLGRHRDKALTPVDRKDAILVLRLSLAVFEYLSDRLNDAGVHA